MTGRVRPARLRDDARGATIIEFGLILFPLMVMLLGTLELGYATYLRAMVQGALQHAARQAAIGNKTKTAIDGEVRTLLAPLVSSAVYANCAAGAGAVPLVCTDVRSYSNFSRIGKGEKLTTDNNGNGSYDPGDCYEDANDNLHYDNADNAGRSAAGNADDVVYYTVKVVYRRLTPMPNFLGWSATNTVQGTTALRNQPFADPVPVVTRCN